MSPVLLLASRSPRRAALLEAAGIAFEQGAFPDVDESVPRRASGEPFEPGEAVRRLAVRKAHAAGALEPDRLLLTADTLVFRDEDVLGKPADADEARAMLASLSGRTHVVATGVALAGPDGAGGRRLLSGAREARVRLRRLETAEIDVYVASREPLDKAGAYAIQGGAADFVEGLEGERDTVIGLPVDLVRELLGAWVRGRHAGP